MKTLLMMLIFINVALGQERISYSTKIEAALNRKDELRSCQIIAQDTIEVEDGKIFIQPIIVKNESTGKKDRGLKITLRRASSQGSCYLDEDELLPLISTIQKIIKLIIDYSDKSFENKRLEYFTKGGLDLLVVYNGVGSFTSLHVSGKSVPCSLPGIPKLESFKAYLENADKKLKQE